MKIVVNKLFVSIFLLLVFVDTSLADSAPINCSGDGTVCREDGTNLALRVLPKPFSNIYKEQVESKEGILFDNVKAFSPLFVFNKGDLELSETGDLNGWYQVGRTAKNADGWMRASDVMEWRQPLVVVYTAKGLGEDRRKSVLMFNKLDALEKFIEAAKNDPETAEKVYQDIANKKQIENIISKEPEAFIDFKKTHYIYPIISYKNDEIEGNNALYLQLATQLPGQRSDDDNKTLLANKSFQDDSLKKTVLKEGSWIKADIVFVMDLTRSMKPFIEETKKAISSLAHDLAEGVDDLQLGLVGYRDDVNKMPKMEFTVKNFTPDMVDASQLSTILQTDVKQVEFDSDDFQEEVFAGIQEAAANSKWRDNALHIIVLIADASSHEVGEKSSIDITATTLKDNLINNKNIQVFSLHIQDSKFKDDHPVAKQQFETLSVVRGEDKTMYFPIPFERGDPSAFSSVISTVSSTIAKYLGKEGRENAKNAIAGKTKSTDPVEVKVEKAMSALLVEFLGTGTPPTDITGWVFDHDPTPQHYSTLETRILLNKNQLNKLHDALKSIKTQYDKGDKTTETFFTNLQEVSSGISKGGEKLGSIAESGLLPAFINNLPYQSYILGLTKEDFGAIGSSERARFENDIVAKIAEYKRIEEDDSEWITLSDDPNAKKWCTLPLSMLP